MKIMKALYNTISEELNSYFIALIIMLGVVIGLVFVFGICGLFLLSIAFPSFIFFEWDIIRIIALGLLIIFFT
jgi:hypothetical protein